MEKKSHEIDVIALTLFVLKDWKRLMLYGFVGGVIGIIVAFCTPKTYTAEVILAPEMSSGGLGMADNLADMASSFGIDLGTKSSMDAIYPEIYPDIFASYDFVHQLFDVPVRLIDDNTTRTYFDHLKKDIQIPFWDYPMLWLGKALQKPEPVVKGATKGFVDPFRVSRKEAKMVKGISESITCLVDKKTSEITISITDQDAMVAAIMVDTLQRRLQSYITDYRTRKARNDYDYYDKMVKEADAEFKRTQAEYGRYADSHMNPILESVSNEQDMLEQNMSNAYSTYAAMVKMRDQAKAKIQECTPAFTVIQSAKTPDKPSSRPRALTAALFVFLACFIDGIIKLREFYKLEHLKGEV